MWDIDFVFHGTILIDLESIHVRNYLNQFRLRRLFDYCFLNIQKNYKYPVAKAFNIFQKL